MAATVTYPGVYIKEVISGVRSIAGVSTSVAAFIGWTAKGPIDRAELVLNWPDYVLKFGGLHHSSLMSYSVYYFFLNGGQRARIIRVVRAAPPPSLEGGNGNGLGGANEAGNAEGAAATKGAKEASLTLGSLTFNARNPGAWGNAYAIHIEHLPRLPGEENPSRFNLSVLDWKHDPDGAGVPVETFLNLGTDPDKERFVGTALELDSQLIAATQASAPGDLPTQSDWKLTDRVPDGAKLKEGDDGTPLAPTDPTFQQAVLPTVPVGGVYHLDRGDSFNLLCVPGMTDATALGNLQTFCRDRRAFLIADCAQDATVASLKGGPAPGLTGAAAANAAFYFPWLRAPDPLQENRPADFPPCGFIAGLYARTDAHHGVWKAPAGTDASLLGVLGVTQPLSSGEIGVLSPQAVNCIRTLPAHGAVAWGARTLHGDDRRSSEWKYVPVRRTALFIKESLYRATQWVVFEPNHETLWSQIRLNVGAFMNSLFRQGAFQGSSPQDAYFVKCDRDTTTQNDIERGVVNFMVGFAPLKPAEFVILQIQQITGRSQTEENKLEQFTGRSAHRSDPYRDFRFRLFWEGRSDPVAGVRKVSALKRTTEVVEHREGGDPSASLKTPGRSRYEAISLEGCIAHDIEFEQWANAVWDHGVALDGEVSFRRNITIEGYNEAGQKVIAYKLFRCWVSEYQALPDLDANASAVEILTLKLENEGWERVYYAAASAEENFTEPPG